MASYATPADLIARKRWSNIEQVAGDDGVAMQEEDLATDPVTLQALEDASGEVDAALMYLGKYSADQLESLAGNALAHLKRIVCELAYANLVARVEPGKEETIALREQAEKWLEALRNGTNIFGLPEKVAASLPSSSGPTSTTYANNRGFAERCPRFFPTRGAQLPRNRQN